MDLRCRKALSTNNHLEYSNEKNIVNGSEMPKGVEHPGEAVEEGTYLMVNGSEMPKGVEHILPAGAVLDSACDVNGSEMPKGVEH